MGRKIESILINNLSCICPLWCWILTGMRTAFSARHDVSSVQIFYPFHYSGFTDTHWHLCLIEGWFPSVHTFIAMARANNPQLVVLFYCLDPSYPGMSRVQALDVNGFLTNSRELLKVLQETRPTIYVPLAADTEVIMAMCRQCVSSSLSKQQCIMMCA